MEKLSGLVLDLHDDVDGGVLRQIFPDRAGVPDFIKSAAHMPEEERATLPDALFALVLQDGDVTLRKYACVDAGNTALAVEYFLREGYKLPEEAQKTAAANLMVACGWYGLPKSEQLEKVAFGAMLGNAVKGLAGRAIGAVKANPIGAGMGALGAASNVMAAKGAVDQIGDNLKNVGQQGLRGY